MTIDIRPHHRVQTAHCIQRRRSARQCSNDKIVVVRTLSGHVKHRCTMWNNDVSCEELSLTDDDRCLMMSHAAVVGSSCQPALHSQHLPATTNRNSCNNLWVLFNKPRAQNTSVWVVKGKVNAKFIWEPMFQIWKRLDKNWGGCRLLTALTLMWSERYRHNRRPTSSIVCPIPCIWIG